jgi:hypothetical protein
MSVTSMRYEFPRSKRARTGMTRARNGRETGPRFLHVAELRVVSCLTLIGFFNT